MLPSWEKVDRAYRISQIGFAISCCGSSFFITTFSLAGHGDIRLILAAFVCGASFMGLVAVGMARKVARSSGEAISALRDALDHSHALFSAMNEGTVHFLPIAPTMWPGETRH